MLRREPFFLGSGPESLFALATWPEGPPRGAVLHVHPFAEELNRSRRMTALAAKEMARAGWLVLQVDLRGCGDSAGDFGHASWADWIHDLDRASQWLRERVSGPVHLWTLRAGSLVASSWLHHRGAIGDNLSSWMGTWLMWQPVLQGKQYLTQFLRIRLGADLSDGRDSRLLMAGLRDELALGCSVEIAGYMLSPGLAVGLEAAQLTRPSGWTGPVAFLEVSSSAHATSVVPALATLSDRWQDAGVTCHAQAVRGPRFWQTPEIEVALDLIAPSLAALTLGER